MIVASKKRQAIPIHRLCRVCKGAGEAYHKRRKVRYYKCKACGHTWQVEVTTQILTIESRTFEVREPPP